MASKIREKQIAAIHRMLNLNVPMPPAKNITALEPVWKVLIYDRAGQDIIFPLLGVKDLRDMGVTLHLLLHSDREPIPDVPALYFVLPTEENVQRICQDLQQGVYESYYFNFISPISRQRLEDIAAAAIAGECVAQVHKIFDQYLNFISLEEDLFMLKHQRNEAFSYYGVNRGDIKNEEMESIMDSIVDGLFCVFATLGTIPIIRCPRGNAAEMVAEKLDKKLRDNVRDPRNSLFNSAEYSPQLSFHRPLLVIIDRNADLATLLHHTWTYQALIHDVLELDLNRVQVSQQKSHAGETSMGKMAGKRYDLEPSDLFWTQRKGCPFPEVAEAVQEELDQYRASEDKVKQLKSAMGLGGDTENDEAISMISDNTAKLTSAVSSLPELLEKKRLIDLHMTVATAVLDEIKARKLDVYFEMEEKIMSRSQLDRSLMDMITDPDFGTPEDKLRLFLICYICSNPAISQVELDQYSTALGNAGCDLAPLRYMKRWKAFSNLGQSSLASQYGGGGTKTVNMFSRLMTQGSSFVMEGVKNLVVKKHNLPVTRIVESLMEQKTSSEVEDYRYFDPKLLRSAAAGDGSGSGARSRVQYTDAVVFTVGGGNYIEYQNLMDYAKSRAGASGAQQKQIIYGSTNLQNATHFLKQLGMLGNEITS